MKELNRCDMFRCLCVGVSLHPHTPTPHTPLRNGFQAELRIDITVRGRKSPLGRGSKTVLQRKIRAGQAEIAISEFYCQANSPFNRSESNRNDDYNRVIQIGGAGGVGDAAGEGRGGEEGCINENSIDSISL